MGDEARLPVLFADMFGPDGTLRLAVLISAAVVSYVALRLLSARTINRATKHTKTEWDDILAKRGVFRHFAFIAPAVVLYFGIDFVVGTYPAIAGAARQIILAYLVVNVVIVLDRLMSAGLDIYQLYPVSEKQPIKGYVQLAKLVLYIVGTVTAISVLVDRSPWGILGGVGAITALLILVFRDTIVSLIASIQIVANDLVDIGDWIEVPKSGADGEVIDIALHTVKVRNWDNTIITVPTSTLIDDAFKNWRGMHESQGRRIKRSLMIDQTSVRFCDDALIERFWRIRRLRPYLEAKKKELEATKSELHVGKDEHLPLNRRALTNLGTFRAYIAAYLDENAKLRDDMTVMVRQRPPTPEGLPLEVYSFTDETSLVDYEGVQADIFDHLLAALPFFDLRVFQNPTGHDVQTAAWRTETG